MNNSNNLFVDTCASDRSRIMNDRAYSRLVPSKPLQPYLSVAPVQTKYTVLPIVNHRSLPKEQLTQRPIYNISDTFNPGSDVSPWSGFASEINTESDLRNQIYALQKCSQAVYVPKSTSDLYTVRNSHPTAQPQPQPFPGLFTEYVAPSNIASKQSKGPQLFNNSTRTMLHDEDPC